MKRVQTSRYLLTLASPILVGGLLGDASGLPVADARTVAGVVEVASVEAFHH